MDNPKKKYALQRIRQSGYVLLLLFMLLIGSCQAHDAKTGGMPPSAIPAQSPQKYSPAIDTAAPINLRIRSIIQDKNGNLWFATQGDGVCKYDPAKDKVTYFTKKDGLCSNYVLTILEDQNGQLWFGTEAGVCCYDGQTFRDFSDQEGPWNLQVWSSLKDKNDRLWFSTEGGICRYDPEKGKFARFDVAPVKHKQKELHTPFLAYCMFEDRTGNIWFGTTQKGACRYDGAAFTYFTEKGLSRVMFSIFQDKTGKMWFGMNGGGVCRYDGTSFLNFSEEKGLSTNLAQRKLDDENQMLNRVISITEDDFGNLWFGTLDEGVWRYDGKDLRNFTVKDGLSHTTVSTIFKDTNGALWLGSEGGGLCRFDGGTFVPFRLYAH